MNGPAENSEGLQVLRYRAGGAVPAAFRFPGAFESCRFDSRSSAAASV